MPALPHTPGDSGKDAALGKAVLRSVFLEWCAVGDRMPPRAWGAPQNP